MHKNYFFLIIRLNHEVKTIDFCPKNNVQFLHVSVDLYFAAEKQ